jgi:hypothetical protein
MASTIRKLVSVSLFPGFGFLPCMYSCPIFSPAVIASFQTSTSFLFFGSGLAFCPSETGVSLSNALSLSLLFASSGFGIGVVVPPPVAGGGVVPPGGGGGGVPPPGGPPSVPSSGSPSTTTWFAGFSSGSIGICQSVTSGSDILGSSRPSSRVRLRRLRVIGLRSPPRLNNFVQNDLTYSCSGAITGDIHRHPKYTESSPVLSRKNQSNRFHTTESRMEPVRYVSGRSSVRRLTP